MEGQAIAGLSHVALSQVDNAMDEYGNFDVNVNKLPPRCDYCTFPDLDFVPTPYALARGIDSSKEIEALSQGNLVVRPRVREILAAAVGEQITFHPTCHWKTRMPTAWSLAAPNAIQPNLAFAPRADIPTCPKCGQPRTGHGTHWVSTGLPNPPMTADICKTASWMSYEQTGEQAGYYWMHVLKLKQPPTPREGVWTRLGVSRGLFLSLRLYTLLRELKVIGLVPAGGTVKERPTASDRQWIEEKLAILRSTGIAGSSGKRSPAEGHDWFDGFLSRRKGKGCTQAQAKEAERRLGIPLPASYQRFMTRLGPKTFRNIEGEPGFDVTILTPGELDSSGHWLIDPDEVPTEDAPARAVAFASTGHGDCFVFDVGAGLDGEYPVFLYQHELNCYEPYAGNFATCIKRFVG